MWSLRTGKVVFFALMCGLLIAALSVSSLIADRQNTLKDVSRYNICWLASQAVAEFTRLEEKIAAANMPGSPVDVDDVQLRFDILSNRLSVMDNGEFKEFAARDPDHASVVTQLADTITKLGPMIEQIRKPGVARPPSPCWRRSTRGWRNWRRRPTSSAATGSGKTSAN